jgi:GMP synthase (glutamine-hydrolysing)
VREAACLLRDPPQRRFSDDFIRAFATQVGIILSGGPNASELGIPVMGICYGMQWMAQTLGGKVEPGTVREFGYAEIRARGHSKLLEGLQDGSNDAGHGLLDVWMSHGDKVTALPAGFNLIAANPILPDRSNGQ